LGEVSEIRIIDVTMLSQMFLHFVSVLQVHKLFTNKQRVSQRLGKDAHDANDVSETGVGD